MKKFKQSLSTFLSFTFLLSFLAISPQQHVLAATNLASGKVATSSTSVTNISRVTDGSKDTNVYYNMTTGLQWIQIDLGASYNLSDIKVWHYFAGARKYHDVVVQVSNSSTFTSNVTTVFNNDTNSSAGLGAATGSEYAETSAGKDIPVSSVNARYVRLYSNGSNVNAYNHYVEVEVYGSTGTTVVNPTSVSLNKTTDSIAVGATDKLTATVAPTTATNKSVTWSSSDATIASVATDGTVTGLKAGAATITAKTVDGGLTATCSVNVGASVSNLAKNKIATSSTSVTDISLVTDGSKDTNQYYDMTTGLQWIQLDLGANYNLSDIKLWHYFADARKYHDVVVQVSNSSTFASGVTTVFNNDTNNSAGLGTGTGSEYAETSAGKDIPVSSVNARYVRLYSNGSSVNAYNHYVEVEVYGSAGAPAIPATSVTLNKTTDALTTGGTDTLTATVMPADASNKNVTWTSSAPGVATVSSTGLVTAVSAGTATITVKTVDGGFTKDCVVTVQDVHATAVALNKTTDTIATGATDKLIPTFTPANTTNKNVTWSSSDATVASVATDGTVTGVKAGTATITVKTADGGFTKDCVVTVQDVHPTNVSISAPPSPIEVGAKYTLVPTFTPANTTNKNVTWSSSDTTVATVSATGEVTGVKAGTAAITVKTVDGALTSTCNVTIAAPALGNLAAGKKVTASSTAFANLTQATDGIKSEDNYADSGTASGLQWIQVDLGASYNVSYIELWHYYGSLRQYHDVVVQLSNDPTFNSGVTTVYNNDTNNSAGRGTGTKSEYLETGAGLNIAFNPVNARYARFYSSGSNINNYNHYSEVEIFSKAPSTVANGNLVAGKTLTTSIPFTNLALANDGNKSSNNYADGSTGLQWLQADLGGSYDVSYIKLYHFYNGGRKYHDVIVQLSDDPNFKSGVTTVYNNDANNSAGLGTGAYNEYAETGLGLEITIASVKARYIRCYSNGNTVNASNHYVELEAYEEAPASKPLSNAVKYLNIPTYEGSGQSTHPGVAYFANGWNGYKYWMAYTPYPNSQDAYENPSVCASNDGITWVIPSGLDNPLASRPAVGHNCDAELIYNSKTNQLMLYYVETNDANTCWVKLIKSSNGVDWTSPQAVITDTRDAYSILSPTVDYNADAGVYYMWSMNAHPDDSAAGQQYFIERRQSSDGINWSAQTTLSNFGQINTEIWHLSVRYIPSMKEYWAFAAAYPEGNTTAATEEYFLKSTDGLNWTSYPNKPVIATESGWDSFRIYRSSFIYDPATDIIKVWYSASNADAGFWGIGYTTNTYTNMMYNLLY